MLTLTTHDTTRHARPPQSLERVIDDFVFMSFLVGNDFTPHLPSVDIGEKAFDYLFDTYRACAAR